MWTGFLAICVGLVLLLIVQERLFERFVADQRREERLTKKQLCTIEIRRAGSAYYPEKEILQIWARAAPSVV